MLSAPLIGALPAMMLPAAKRTAQILPARIPRMVRKRIPQWQHATAQSCNLGLILRTRIQR